MSFIFLISLNFIHTHSEKEMNMRMNKKKRINLIEQSIIKQQYHEKKKC